MGYTIMLYNAGKKIRCFGKFKSYSVAKCKFDELIDTNLILFPKFSNFIGHETDYELVMLGPATGKHISHVRDDMGRKVTLNAPGNTTIKKINEFYVEDCITHRNTGKRYYFKEFVKEFIVSIPGPKSIYSVHNKLVIEHLDTEDIDLFVIKNQEDSVRLNDTIKAFCAANKINNNFFFTTLSNTDRKEVYNVVNEKLGIDRVYMRRTSTR